MLSLDRASPTEITNDKRDTLFCNFLTNLNTTIESALGCKRLKLQNDCPGARKDATTLGGAINQNTRGSIMLRNKTFCSCGREKNLLDAVKKLQCSWEQFHFKGGYDKSGQHSTVVSTLTPAPSCSGFNSHHSRNFFQRTKLLMLLRFIKGANYMKEDRGLENVD